MAKLDDKRPYIVMEFIEGHTLASLVRSGGAPLGGVVQVMMEVLSALSAAHAIGIVHRDLKPDNVLVTGEGHAKVLDFGIAKLLPGISQQLSPRTRTGALLGTPAYMAPEQISGSGNIDPRTDIYAAGIVLYEAVTGRVPFAGETLFDLMRMHLETAPQPPSALRSDLPAPMEEVILQALAKDPAQRFQSATAMAQALQHASKELRPEEWRSLSTRGAIITGGQVSATHISRPPQSGPRVATSAAPPPSQAEQPTRAAKQKSNVPWLIGLGIAATLGAIVTVLLVKNSGESKPEPKQRREPNVVEVPAPPPIEDEPPQPTEIEPAGGSGSATPTPPPPTKTTPQPKQNDTSVKITQDQIVIKGGSKQELTLAADYTAKNFDPVAYLPKALAVAKRLLPDAHLTRFDFDGVYSDGHVDLTAMPDGDRGYQYRSPSASKRSGKHAPNVPEERACMVYIELEPKRIVARVVTSDECNDKLVRDPKCKLATVWKKAIEAGAPKDHVAKIGWLFDEKWFFTDDIANNGDGVTESFADQCQ
jgi:serine/threonine-protein kinase